MMAEEEWTMMTGGLAERAADRAAYDDYLAAMASDNSAFRAAFRDAFFEALREEMTDRQYEVLWMREVEGLSGKEIAYKLGISQSAVSRHLTRGKKQPDGHFARPAAGLCGKGPLMLSVTDAAAGL